MKIIEHKSMKRSNAGDRAARLYFQEVSKIPLLTLQEERELGARAKEGDLGARQKLIEGNLRFVIKIAKKFVRRPDQLMDLINVGNMGLIEASQRFDPERNVRFTSYAVWWIRQAIFHYLTESTYAFRISPKIANILYRTGRVLSNRVEAVIDREQLAKQVGVTLEQLNAALSLISQTVSLDQAMTEEGDIPLSDRLEQTLLPSPEEQAIVHSMRSHLDRSIQRLKPVEQHIIRLRFGLNDHAPMTLKEIGDKLDLSRERIRQLESKALDKLREMQMSASLVNYLS